MTSIDNVCTCGNRGCSVRIQRGLIPFCKMPSPSSSSRHEGYSSYSEAVKHAPEGAKVQLISGGLGTGSPHRFGFVTKTNTVITHGKRNLTLCYWEPEEGVWVKMKTIPEFATIRALKTSMKMIDKLIASGDFASEDLAVFDGDVRVW